MDSKGLRLGNHFKDREGRLCSVEELAVREEPRIVSIGGPLTSLPVKPIPLVKDEFLAYGFKHTPNDMNGGMFSKEVKYEDSLSPAWELKIWDMGNETNPIFLVVYSDKGAPKGVGIPNKMEYVHDLQNLYYELSGGQELKRKKHGNQL